MLPRASFSAGEASLSMRSACPGCVAITTASKFSLPSGVPTSTPSAWRRTEVTGLASRTSGSVAASSSSVVPESAGHSPPLRGARDTQQAVVRQESEEVACRVGQRRGGIAGPDGADHGRHEVRGEVVG